MSVAAYIFPDRINPLEHVLGLLLATSCVRLRANWPIGGDILLIQILEGFVQVKLPVTRDVF